MNVWTTLDATAKPTRVIPWPELETPLDLQTPKSVVPVLFASPHSGRVYPQKFHQLSTLDPHSLKTSEDAWVDELFSDAPRFGASLLCAHFPRAMLDANRASNELDPSMFSDYCPTPNRQNSARVLAGLGVVPRMVSAEMPIYDRKIPYKEAVQRLHHLHRPYHKTLGTELAWQKKTFGRATLIDCHSMPADCANQCPGGVTDFVLGDGHGQTCNPALIAHIERTLMDMGYRVIRNTPYAGGYSTLCYGKPQERLNALQIEISRALYMDENTLLKNRKFNALRKDIKQLCQSICTFTKETP